MGVACVEDGNDSTRNGVCRRGARDSDTLDEARAWGAGPRVIDLRVCSGVFLLVGKFGSSNPFQRITFGDIFEHPLFLVRNRSMGVRVGGSVVLTCLRRNIPAAATPSYASSVPVTESPCPAYEEEIIGIFSATSARRFGSKSRGGCQGTEYYSAVVSDRPRSTRSCQPTRAARRVCPSPTHPSLGA